MDRHIMNRTISSNLLEIRRSTAGGGSSPKAIFLNTSQMSGGLQNNTAQYKSSSTLFQTIDRGATTSLLQLKANKIMPYFDQADDLQYTDEGELISTTITDQFNKRFIANLDPKTIQEEFNIRKGSGSSSQLGIKAKMSRQLLNRSIQKNIQTLKNMRHTDQKAPFGDIGMKHLPSIDKIKVSSQKNTRNFKFNMAT